MKSLVERFSDKYQALPWSGCWIWVGSLCPETGYGAIFAGSGIGRRGAHRISYELHKGKIPDGLVIDHICRIKSCVNPDHLRAVTHKFNMEVGATAVRTHCNSGHEFTPENTSSHHGYRRCKTCHREQERVKNKKLRQSRLSAPCGVATDSNTAWSA